MGSPFEYLDMAITINPYALMLASTLAGCAWLTLGSKAALISTPSGVVLVAFYFLTLKSSTENKT
jgi:hypothetical protein